MNFYLLENLDFENYEFKANEVILTNSLIFNDYFYSVSNKGFSAPESVPLPPRISHSDSIKYTGNIVFDSCKLLDKLFSHFNSIRNLCSDEEILDFLNNKSRNADFDKHFLDINNNFHFHQELDNKIINVLIDFFKEFGFANDTVDYISLIKLKYTVIPKILIISLVNTLYETITLFTFKNVEYDYKQELLESKFNDIVFITNLLQNRKNSSENTFDITTIDFLVTDFKTDLLNIVNKFTLFFGPVNLYSYIDFSDEKNKAVPSSDDIFGIAWYLMTSKIQLSFAKGKFKKCVICR